MRKIQDHRNCIYAYRNKANGKYYVGQSKSFNKRHKQHLAGKAKGFDRELARLGEDAFEILILEEELDKELMDERETYYIAKLKAFTDGYNMVEEGGGGRPKLDVTKIMTCVRVKPATLKWYKDNHISMGQVLEDYKVNNEKEK